MTVRQIISKVCPFVEIRCLFMLLNDNFKKFLIFEEIQTYLGGGTFFGTQCILAYVNKNRIRCNYNTVV